MTALRPCLTVGLLWHSFSSDNLGVGALSVSQIAICESAAKKANVDLSFIVFGTSGTRNYIPADKPIEICPDISFRELLTGRSPFMKYLQRCDIVLDIGEGDSFADIYGMRRFRVHIATKIAVLAKRIPLILSPQTIGPFDRWYSRRLASWIMRRCARVYARDGLSYAYLESLGLMGDGIDEVTDVAFRLPFSSSERTNGFTCRIGVNVSGLLFSGGYEGLNQFGLMVDYPRLIRDLLKNWCSDAGNEVWLIPHVLADSVPKDDDRIAIAELAKEFAAAKLAPEFTSPSMAKSFIATMDFMTGARMHACIAAFSSGVPVVPFSYSRKFNGLFSSLGYGWLADGKSMSNEIALAKIIGGFERREELRAEIRQGMSRVENSLSRYENDLANYMTDIQTWPIGKAAKDSTNGLEIEGSNYEEHCHK